MFHQVVEELALKIEPSFKPVFNNICAVFAYVLPKADRCASKCSLRWIVETLTSHVFGLLLWISSAWHFLVQL